MNIKLGPNWASAPTEFSNEILRVVHDGGFTIHFAFNERFANWVPVAQALPNNTWSIPYGAFRFQIYDKTHLGDDNRRLFIQLAPDKGKHQSVFLGNAEDVRVNLKGGRRLTHPYYAVWGKASKKGVWFNDTRLDELLIKSEQVAIAACFSTTGVSVTHRNKKIRFDPKLGVWRTT